MRKVSYPAMASLLSQAGINEQHAGAIVGTINDIVARAIDAAGNEAAANLSRQTKSMEDLLARMQHQQGELQKAMGDMNAEKEKLKEIME